VPSQRRGPAPSPRGHCHQSRHAEAEHPRSLSLSPAPDDVHLHACHPPSSQFRRVAHLPFLLLSCRATQERHATAKASPLRRNTAASTPRLLDESPLLPPCPAPPPLAVDASTGDLIAFRPLPVGVGRTTASPHAWPLRGDHRRCTRRAALGGQATWAAAGPRSHAHSALWLARAESPRH
jgi:hypothetical protein